ncbi:SDR family oxidoreductase, partial [Promicromonospora citrea]
DHLASPADAGISVSKNQGQAPRRLVVLPHVVGDSKPVKLVEAREHGLIYASSKAALCRWLRRTATSPRWAGAGIPLNAVAPGVVETPMVAGMIGTEIQRAAMAATVPMPLNGFMRPEVPAHLLTWLVGEKNTHLCGQVVFVDGGADALIRGDSTW